MTGLVVDDAAWASAWRGRAAADKLLLCAGLLVCALALPAWPGAVLVTAAAILLAVGPARVPAGTFLRAIRWPLAFIAVGAVTAVVTLDGSGLAWAPDAAERAGQLAGRAVAGSAAVLLLATTTPMSDLLPLLRRLRVPDAVVEVASVTYRLLFVLLESLAAVREAQTARMGWSTARRSYRSAGMLAAAVLTRSWDRARRMQEGLAGRGMEAGLRVLPDERRSSPSFRAAALALPVGIAVLTVVAR